MCTVMRHYKRVTDAAGCHTEDVQRVFSCEGGCGKVTGYCCDPTELSYKHVQFVCPGGATKVAKVATRTIALNGSCRHRMDITKYRYR